jgi:hypothetical protein
VGLINLAEDRDSWQAVVNMVWNLQLSKEVGNLTEDTVKFSRTLVHGFS